MIISGDVQAVGFRSWVRYQAQELKLKGWIKNRSDGTVEAVAEGEEKNLRTLITLCRQGPPAALVKHAQISWQSYLGKFENFSIVY